MTADTATGTPATRAQQLDRGLNLEYLTVGWNAVEAVVAVVAGLAAGSIALVGFGLDSIVEGTSGGVMIWRLRRERAAPGEREAIEQTEQRAQRWVAYSLFALAGVVAVESVRSLVIARVPSASIVGIVLAVLSLAVMWWLAREKRDVAHVLGSRAMAADAFQTDACFWLSLILLVGIGANAVAGWWWADPVAALAMCWFIVDEGREVLEDEGPDSEPTADEAGPGEERDSAA